MLWWDQWRASGGLGAAQRTFPGAARWQRPCQPYRTVPHWLSDTMSSSRCLVIRLNIMLIPQWLLQEEQSPLFLYLFLYKWMMLASPRSRGSWLFTQNTWNSLVRWVMSKSLLALNTSAGIPSGPGAFPVCNCLMAAVFGRASSSGIKGRWWIDLSASLVTFEVWLSRVLK